MSGDFYGELFGNFAAEKLERREFDDPIRAQWFFKLTPSQVAHRIASTPSAQAREAILGEIESPGWRWQVRHEAALMIADDLSRRPIPEAEKMLIEVPESWRSRVAVMVASFRKARRVKARIEAGVMSKNDPEGRV